MGFPPTNTNPTNSTIPTQIRIIKIASTLTTVHTTKRSRTFSQNPLLEALVLALISIDAWDLSEPNPE